MGRDLFDIALMKKFGGGSGGGGVSSWNDLTDKPFYEESGEVVYASGEYTSEYDSNFGVFCIYVPWCDRELKPPTPFTVIFDGAAYEVSQIVNIPSMGNMFGNLGLLNDVVGTSFENTGEPFVGVVGRNYCTLYVLDTAPTKHNVKISALGTIAHTISKQYLPVYHIKLSEELASYDGSRTTDDPNITAAMGDKLLQSGYDLVLDITRTYDDGTVIYHRMPLVVYGKDLKQMAAPPIADEHIDHNYNQLMFSDGKEIVVLYPRTMDGTYSANSTRL